MKPTDNIKIEYDVPDGDMDSKCKTEGNSPPRLIFFWKSGKFFTSKVVADGVIFETEADDIEFALMVLLGLYYTLNVHFPAEYCCFMGLTQHLSTNHKYVSKRTKYAHLFKKLSELMEKMETVNPVFASSAKQ